MVALGSERLVAQRTLGRALRRSSRLTQNALEGALSRADLTFAQWSALRVVADAGGITVGDLAREIEMTSGAMTRLVDCLEQRGLVRRDRSHSDRRQVRIVSTDAADALLETANPSVTGAWSELLTGFSIGEIVDLTEHLSKLVTALERREASGPLFNLEAM